MSQKKDNTKVILRSFTKICRNPFLILMVITVGIVSFLLSVQMRIGVPYWDVFNYLNNALYFAGMSSNGINSVTYLPPLLPLLTSLFFRMGYVSINIIFILSALIFVIGVIGLYLLLKERFNPIQSLTGSLIFISFPVVMSWAATGGIDIPGVSFSIWTIYFMVIGLKRDSKYLYLVLPLLLLATVARYTSGLIVIPMLLYLLINQKKIRAIKNIKKVIFGIALEFAIIIMILGYFMLKLDIVTTIINLFFQVTTSSASAVGDVAYNPNNLYFLQNILNYISVAPFQGSYHQILNPSLGTPSILAYIIALITIIGLSFYIHRGLSSKIKRMDKSFLNYANITKITLLVVMIILLVTSFYYNSFILSEIILLAILYILYRFLGNIRSEHPNNKLDLDFLFLSWFGSYLIFESILPFKVDRYFTTMAPALAYFIILGLNEFIAKIKPKIKYSNLKIGCAYLILALLLLSSATATYIGHTPKKTFTIDISDSCDWIKENDPNYKDKIICSDYPNAVSWYLKKEIMGGFPRFFNNTDGFAEYLQENNVDYYIDTISKTHPDLKGYRIVKSFGVVAIYEKIRN